MISISISYYQEVLDRKLKEEKRAAQKKLRKESATTFSERDTLNKQNSFIESPACETRLCVF